MSDFTLHNPIGSDVQDEDVRTTPRWLFDAFDHRLRFTLDAAASPANALCENFITADEDALTVDWVARSCATRVVGSVWCNPPFSRLGEFAQKAAEAGASVPVAFIMPANRWEQLWLHRTVLATSTYIVFPEGRVAYGGSGKSPEWPSAVVVWLPWDLGRRRAMSLSGYVSMLGGGGRA